jgi:ArsR family transcriptional regulator, virulence genes transcriptional regulator
MTSQSDNFEELAVVFQALNHPSRLRILTLLSKGEMTGAAIAKKLGIPTSTASMHLTRLCLGGLIVRQRDKQQVFYSIADLSEHCLGEKSTAAKARSNAARFGPMELAYPEK